MFQGCYKLETLDVGNWNTSKVTAMSTMFGWCHALHSLDLSRWEVSNVVSMQDMFIECTSLVSLNLSNWDVSKARSLRKLFRDCFSLNKLDLSGWVLNENLDYLEMFFFCNMLFPQTSKACEITCTQAVQELLLNKLDVTGMDPAWFIWTNGKVNNGGSSVEDMPNQDW